MARKIGEKEVVQGWLYDRVKLTAGVTYNTIRMFQNPVGSAAAPNYWWTNCKVGGFMPGVHEFTIKSMFIKFNDLIHTANAQAVQQGYGGLLISEKVYPDYFPLELALGGPHLRETVRGPAAAPEFRSIAGPGDINNVMSFTRPFLVTIGKSEIYNFELNWPGGITPANDEDIYILVCFYGRGTRAVV